MRGGRARRVALRWMAVLAVAGLAVGACGNDANDDGSGGGGGSNTTDPGKPQAGGILRYALNAETDGWNPTKNRWADSGQVVAMAVFDRLALHDVDGNAIPFLAETFAAHDGYLNWDIKLRAGVKFHDGTPLDAEAVKRNLELHRASPLTAPGFAPVESIDVVDDLTLSVHMKDPWATFPHIFTTQVGAIAAPSQLDDPDGVLKPVGTGPFSFVRWTRDKELVVRKNPDYWQKGFPYLDEIQFSVVTDELSRNAGLINGQFDVAMVNTAEEVKELDELADAGQMQVHRSGKGEVADAFVILNLDDPVLKDQRLRKALAMATDQQAMIQTVYAGMYKPATGPFVPTSPFYVDSGYPKFDLEGAKALVAEYTAENGKPKIELLGPPSPTDLKRRQLLQSMWDAAGFEVELVSGESAANILNVITGRFQAASWGQFDQPHPDGDYVWWHSSNAKPTPGLALNMARNRDPDIDSALDDARTSGDLTAQKQAYEVLQKRLSEDLPYIWLYHTDDVVASQPYVHDVTNWKLPTGEQGLPLLSMRHPHFQIWMSAQD